MGMRFPYAPEGRIMRVLLVDDHPAVREGVGLLLEAKLGLDITSAASADEALSLVKDTDLVLLDLSMRCGDGIGLLRKLREASPQTPVLVLSTYGADVLVRQAIEAGAAGYVLKDTTVELLRSA